MGSMGDMNSHGYIISTKVIKQSIVTMTDGSNQSNEAEDCMEECAYESVDVNDTKLSVYVKSKEKKS